MLTGIFKFKNGLNAKAEQHPFNVVDSTPLPLFMASAIVIGLLHVAFLSHTDSPIHDQGIFLTKFLENGNNAASTLALLWLALVLLFGSRKNISNGVCHCGRYIIALYNNCKFVLNKLLCRFKGFSTTVLLTVPPIQNSGSASNSATSSANVSTMVQNVTSHPVGSLVAVGALTIATFAAARFTTWLARKTWDAVRDLVTRDVNNGPGGYVEEPDSPQIEGETFKQRIIRKHNKRRSEMDDSDSDMD